MDTSNQQKRAWTRSEIQDMGLDLSEFNIPSDTKGELTGTLVTRAWPKKSSFRKSLICYFVTDEGEKYFLLAFQDLKSKLYKPRSTDIDFTEVEIGSRFKLSYSVSKGNWPNWIDAEPL
jgi:hypothetical protein